MTGCVKIYEMNWVSGCISQGTVAVLLLIITSNYLDIRLLISMLPRYLESTDTDVLWKDNSSFHRTEDKLNLSIWKSQQYWLIIVTSI